MLGGQWEYPENPGYTDPHYLSHRLYGSQDAEGLFHGALRTTTPWPKAAGLKSRPLYDRGLVTAELQQPPNLYTFDPRYLHATQAHVTRQGVDYYMGDDYQITGHTFADQDNVGNAYPMVYRDYQGRNLLLSGHHRATVDLLRGRPLRARFVREQ